ncbi:MAG: hypothetical protein JXR75_06355 [Rhodobacteraceae bacterium]|nr:hypothetical protein [Paracoccaceae bacterium]
MPPAVHRDTLNVLREQVRDPWGNLICLDPPFHSNAGDTMLFMGPSGTESVAQFGAFEDTRHWNDSVEAAFGDVMRSGNAAASTMLWAMRLDLPGYCGERSSHFPSVSLEGDGALEVER